MAETPILATTVFEEMESEVRSYCRFWPAVFASAKGCYVFDECGREYLDFFSGAGALNYGHNNPYLREALLSYLNSDALVHSLDMYTPVKRQLLEVFRQRILSPRALDYKVQFSGPAGAMAVEAALKLALKYTGRRTIVSFTNGFHGMTLAALSVAGRAGSTADGALTSPVVLPYDGQHGAGESGLLLLNRLLERDVPAAVIVETVQGDGGLYTATAGWLRRLASMCKQHGVLLILDDVQMCCGRTGPFFSFEASGIYPDIVCVSKSFSGYGLPLALTLIRPELDVWAPGEHTGTFRGFNPAYATAVAAMDFWRDGELERTTLDNGALIEESLRLLAARYDGPVTEVRGRGMAWGVAFSDPDLAGAVRTQAFARGLILETCGNQGEVVKLLPPLIADRRDLTTGLSMLADAVDSGVAAWTPRPTAPRAPAPLS